MSVMATRYRWILLLSLALNLALAAFVVFRPSTHEGRGRGLSMVLPPPHVIARILSPEGRQILERVVSVHRDSIRPTLQAFSDSRHNIQQLLRAEVVDRTAMTAAFAELRQREQQTAERVQLMMIELSAQLPLSDRQKMADVIDRGHGGRQGRRERRERKSDTAQPDQTKQAADADPAATQ